MIRNFVRRVLPYAYQCARLWWWITQPKTLGARVLVERDGEVLLVRLNYLNQWHLPGGGTQKGESLAQTATRELTEETGMTAPSVRLFGIYYNRAEKKHDHVALYIAENSFGEPGSLPSVEIAERRFFPIDKLPSDASQGTRNRIQEVYYNASISDRW